MSSLSAVVSNLVRASMGPAISTTVTDEDLDRHVAELILKEAKQKAERYSKEGIRAYLRNNELSESNAPKANKRFLSSIIRSTDDHNKVVLRAQALAAQEIKKEREESERKERRLRAEEAVDAERLRRLMGGSSRRSESDSWDRRDNRKRKRRSRSEDDYHGHDDRDHGTSRRSNRHQHDSRKTRRRRSPSASCKQDSRSPSRSKRESSRSGNSGRPRDIIEDDSRKHMLRSLSSDPHLSDENRESLRRHRLKSNHKAGDDGSRPRRSHSTRSPESESPTPRQLHRSPPCPTPLSPTPQLPSKMDKYFEASYDPRLDVAPLSMPSIPASGLVDNAQFEGWDAMLELIRMRREDKEEKKRMERLGLTKEKPKKNKGDSTGVTDRWSDVGVSVMDIEYKKKGAVREWDMGKEGF